MTTEDEAEISGLVNVSEKEAQDALLLCNQILDILSNKSPHLSARVILRAVGQVLYYAETYRIVKDN